MSNFGYVIIIFGMIVVAVDMYRSQPSSGRLVGLTAFMLLIGVLGYAIINEDTITEADFGKFGSIHKAATQALTDAKTVSSLKKQVESQRAAIDAVAEQARRADEISSSTENIIKQTRAKLTLTNKSIDEAAARINSLNAEIAFADEVQAAESDNRVEYDKLFTTATDVNDPFQSRAAAAVRAIAFSHNQFNIKQYNSEWNKGISPNNLDFNDLVEKFALTTDPDSRLSIIQFLNNSPIISKLFKASFDVGIVKTSASLNEIEIAIRGL